MEFSRDSGELSEAKYACYNCGIELDLERARIRTDHWLFTGKKDMRLSAPLPSKGGDCACSSFSSEHEEELQQPMPIPQSEDSRRSYSSNLSKNRWLAKPKPKPVKQGPAVVKIDLLGSAKKPSSPTRVGNASLARAKFKLATVSLFKKTSPDKAAEAKTINLVDRIKSKSLHNSAEAGSNV